MDCSPLRPPLRPPLSTAESDSIVLCDLAKHKSTSARTDTGDSADSLALSTAATVVDLQSSSADLNLPDSSPSSLASTAGSPVSPSAQLSYPLPSAPCPLTFDSARLDLERRTPFLPLSIDPDQLFVSAIRIATQLFPDWQPTDLVATQCTEGITNKLVKITHLQGHLQPPQQQTILLRCYGQGTGSIIDRTNELVSMHVLAQLGFAPPIYGRFLNGFCYGYVEGRALTPQEIATLPIAHAIAQHLARWHRVSMPCESGNCLEPVIWKTMFRWLEQVPNVYANPKTQSTFLQHQQLLSPSVVLEQLQSLEQRVRERNAPVVFGHNDLLSANIILDERKPAGEQIVFIDYEYGSYSYRGFDIANHFNEYAGFSCDYSRFPSLEFQRKWVEAYLGDGDDPEKVQALLEEVEAFVPVSHFFWGVWALVQASVSDIDFDYMGYAVLRFQQFHQTLRW